MKNRFKIAVSALCIVCAACSAAAFAACNDDGGTAAGSSEGVKYRLNEDKTAYVCGGKAEADIETVVIPATYHELPVTAIDASVFGSCDRLSSVEIPESVTSIGDGAFSGCSSLGSVTLPDGLEFLGKEVFAGCTSLTSVKIPAGLEEIDDGAFKGCAALGEVEFGAPSALVAIGKEAFEGCGALLSVDIPANADGNDVTVGARAFKNCSALTSATFSDDVTSVGGDAFTGSGLTSLEFGAASRLSYIGEDAFKGCKSLATVSLPDKVTSIGWTAFYDTAFYDNPSSWTGDSLIISGKYLIKVKDEFSGGKYEAPAGVKIVAAHAFYGIESVTEVILCDGVESVGAYAFYGCAGLTKVVLPASLKSVGSYVFTGAENAEAYFKGGKEAWQAVDGSGEIAKVLYFSAQPPEAGSSDRFWHEDGGDITEWE